MSENSQDYAQKPQRNCAFMNSASGASGCGGVGGGGGVEEGAKERGGGGEGETPGGFISSSRHTHTPHLGYYVEAGHFLLPPPLLSLG
jgi:hypothetical protein